MCVCVCINTMFVKNKTFCGFQVAWVTKSGKTELAEPIAVRPTSETGNNDWCKMQKKNTRFSINGVLLQVSDSGF